MLNCKPTATPVDKKAKLSAIDGSPASDAASYRSIVGALQYLTLTRPKIQYDVQQVCHYYRMLLMRHHDQRPIEKLCAMQ